MHHDHGGDSRGELVELPEPAATETPPTLSVVVIVLTGGASSRMGRHKPAVDVGGRPILEWVVDAARPHPVLVVGHPDAVPADVPTVADRPPGGGPVAGLVAGLEHVTIRPDPALPASSTSPDAVTRADTAIGLDAALPARPDVVVVLAGDLPFVTRAHVGRLMAELAAAPCDVAVTTDDDGRRNWLCSAWRGDALRGRLAAIGDPVGQSVRRLAQGLVVVAVDHAGEGMDVDTPEDLERARKRAADGDASRPSAP